MSPNVLIIDDSDNFRRQIISSVMDNSLFDNYREAKDGLEGFKSLIDSETDLIICDMQMPRMDGLKFLQMVKTRPELQDIPIFFDEWD